MNPVMRGVGGGMAALLAAASLAVAAGPAPPSYVGIDRAGRLTYAVDERGDRVPDFSHAGYGGGGVPIPDVPARVLVRPAAGDAGGRIQAAIDLVAARPAGANGYRGAVLLAAGRFEVADSLRITASGVVLRGQGRGPDGTTLVATGTGRRPLIRVEGQGKRTWTPEPAARIVDPYVPVGSSRVRLERPDGFRAGDHVVVSRPGTAAWLAHLGMDSFPLGYEGSLNWRPGAMAVSSDRVVTHVDGPVLTLDAPLMTSLDEHFGGGTVRGYAWDGRLERVGVEDLRIESLPGTDNPHDEGHAWDAVRLDAVENAWVRRITARRFAGSAVRILDGGKWITVQDCDAVEPVSEVGGYRRHTFFTSGQMTLFMRCRSQQGRHDFAVGSLAAGPNAFVRCAAADALGFSGPVESWATGVLYDNVSVDGAGLELTNRETDGQGTGWTSANSVLWQCAASVITCRTPPGAHNWAIGCWGLFHGNGHWQAPNEFVRPQSLYEAQLAERLGRAAVEALDERTAPESTAEPLTMAELESSPAAKPAAPEKRLELREGWLSCGGALLTGGRSGTTWWRGSIVPTRVGEFGLGVTRFVPGRDGAGFTDDLDELTDAMLRSGKAALEHHWGLWYDRRRDDHQMVRRADGDVWPPFYEQPWARSGRGTAWDGLSRYDLSKFNPWYFGRLASFASLCDRKGLVLMHQAYFQHNILEAGAHWADFPWRPANCVQDTGFPEPPPYAGGKRVFMADAFYDVTHPVRRAIHRAYIRHCLDVLGRHPNVIFFTGEEFTGPLHFVRFWLDTVTEWERETGVDVRVGLSATKDVQDAILDDPVRGRAVSVIELKYWWYLADGTLYAPAGGKNLAPRQQLREWKGSMKRSAEQNARQVREYRERYPDKAVLFSGGPNDGWAVLAAGGSMPSLPHTTDARLLRALPRLRPAGRARADDRQWVLAEPGRDYVAYARPGAPVRVDLSAEPGAFTALRIDPSTGTADSAGAAVTGGRIVEFAPAGTGPSVIWLTADPTRATPVSWESPVRRKPWEGGSIRWYNWVYALWPAVQGAKCRSSFTNSDFGSNKASGSGVYSVLGFIVSGVVLTVREQGVDGTRPAVIGHVGPARGTLWNILEQLEHSF